VGFAQPLLGTWNDLPFEPAKQVFQVGRFHAMNLNSRLLRGEQDDIWGVQQRWLQSLWTAPHTKGIKTPEPEQKSRPIASLGIFVYDQNPQRTFRVHALSPKAPLLT
jgi:hypothetical protein